MAEEEAEVHGRVAEVAGLIIDHRETLRVREDVFRTVVAVAQRFLAGEHAVDDRSHRLGHFRATLLNPAVEGIHTQLDQDGVVGEPFHQLGIARGRFMHLAEDPSGTFPDRQVDLAAEQCLFPHLRFRRRMAHGEDIVGTIAIEDFRNRGRRQERMQNLHDLLFPVNPVQITQPGVTSA